MPSWVTSVWVFVAGYVRWADAWTLFVSGVIAAGITLPAAGQPNRVWVLATLVILFNVAVNAIRRAKVTITTSPSIGVKVMDPITTLVTAIETAVAAFKNNATVPVSPNQNVTYPDGNTVVSPNLNRVPENASEAAAMAASNAPIVEAPVIVTETKLV